MLEIINNRTRAFVEQMPKSKRKEYGQFFTSVPIAGFMSDLFCVDNNKQTLRILDAGAGAGILSASTIITIRNKGYLGELVLVCYETDPNVVPLLEQNLSDIAEHYRVHYTIIRDNYITSQSFEGNIANDELFDIIVGNPPYKKISKNAVEALSMSPVCYGAPNLYFLFWSMGIHNLKENGELVYIIPRSWTSGAYFEHFREYLHSNCAITHIHLFGSRDNVFKGESVLQETMIIRIKKTQIKPSQITVTFSETYELSNTKTMTVPYNTVVAPNGYVFLVTTDEELEVLKRINRQDSTLKKNNTKMQTGIIVDFRTREVLRDCADEGVYPLFYSQHIKDGKVHFPIGRPSEFICTDRKSFLQDNVNYVFVKRFTAKEEKRRLQCGIYLASEHPEYKFISTQNKINYIRCHSEEEAYGIYAILNSTLYDTYYRILNGSTQVNSTEINNMQIPSSDTVSKIGKELIGGNLSEENCNTIIDKWIK